MSITKQNLIKELSQLLLVDINYISEEMAGDKEVEGKIKDLYKRAKEKNLLNSNSRFSEPVGITVSRINELISKVENYV